MGTLGWIVGGGLLMMAIALVGSVTLFLRERTLERIILPLVAFSAGSLLGGAFLHMIPAAIDQGGARLSVFLWVLAGFALFLAVEQYLHWHHCHRESADCKEPLSYLILLGDALHNFMGGLAVAGAFLIDIRIGIAAWLAAAAHEVPQELGDFGVLLHAGWNKTGALILNVVSGSTFLIGGIVAYAASAKVNIAFLVPLAAGNFIYVGASDLIPEVNRERRVRENLIHFIAFGAGIGLLLLVKVVITKTGPLGGFRP